MFPVGQCVGSRAKSTDEAKQVHILVQEIVQDKVQDLWQELSKCVKQDEYLDFKAEVVPRLNKLDTTVKGLQEQLQLRKQVLDEKSEDILCLQHSLKEQLKAYGFLRRELEDIRERWDMVEPAYLATAYEAACGHGTAQPEVLASKPLAARDQGPCSPEPESGTASEKSQSVVRDLHALRVQLEDSQAAWRRELEQQRGELNNLRGDLTKAVVSNTHEVSRCFQSLRFDLEQQACQQCPNEVQVSPLAQEPLEQAGPHFTLPAHPQDPQSKRITWDVDCELLASLRRGDSSQAKLKLVKKLNLKVHPDKNGTSPAFQWFQGWKKLHGDWFLGEGWQRMMEQEA